MRIIVVGGGISGLTAAYLARSAGHDAVCVEPAAAPGGLVHSARHRGFLCEAGPQAVLDDAPETTALIDAVGLRERSLSPLPAARRRFVFVRGRLRALPASPPAIIRSDLLPPLARLRLLLEPLVRRRGVRAGSGAADLDDDETVAAFGARRLGARAGRLLDTAVIGVYAADAAELSARSALPRLAAMEREHGSLLRGVLAARKRGHRPGRALTFPDGLAELPAALARALGQDVVRARAVAIEPRGGGGWRVVVEEAQRAEGGGEGSRTLEGDAVVLATDAAAAARLLAPLAPAVSAALDGAPTTPIAVCCLGFTPAGPSAAEGDAGADADADAGVGIDLAAYGFLVARGERPRLLGCQYESSTFAGRAPPGGVLLRALLGGRGAGFEPEIVDRPDEEIAARAVADLREIAGLARDPDLVKVWRHPRGIPLYAPGHARRVSEIDEGLRRLPNLHLLGHALRGVGVNESIRAAATLVRALSS